MNRFIAFTILLFSLSISTAFAQLPGSILQLPQLGVRSKSLEIVLDDIDNFIGNKPKGLHYPISKIVFSELDSLVCFEVVGIDNSWTNFFKFGEVPYGYAIVRNRLFLIVVEGYKEMNLGGMFYVMDRSKAFNRSNRPPTNVFKNPVWFFEFKDDQAYLISVADLEALD